MSSSVTLKLIDRAARRFEQQAAQAAQQAPGGVAPPARVITISRQLGSGGRRIAEALSERLGWPVWDRQILDVLASESHRPVQGRLFSMLDERTRGHVETVLWNWAERVNQYQYDYLLPRAILTIAQHDSIILGRGARLFLPHSLRVRVVAPLDLRVQNLVSFEGETEAHARERIRATDHERSEFMQHLRRVYHGAVRLPDHDAEYDLVLNTGTLGIQAATDLIMRAADSAFDLSHRGPVAAGQAA